LSDGAESWTVLSTDYLPVDPIESYLENLRVLESSPNSIKVVATGLAWWWTFVEIGTLDWRGVGVTEVANWVAWLRAQPRYGRPELGPIAATTIESRLSALMAFYGFHADVDGLEVYGRLHRPGRSSRRRSYRSFLEHTRRNQTVMERRVRVRSGRPNRTPVFAARHLDAILGACGVRTDSGDIKGSIRDLLICETLSETGIRSGELLNLRHGDWHTGGGTTPYIEIVPRLDAPAWARVKGGWGRRVYISDRLAALYHDYLWNLCDIADQHGHEVTDESQVFVNLYREPLFDRMKPHSLGDLVDRLNRKVPDLPPRWSCHWFRHTHATALLLSNVPDIVVSRRLGHADVQTTINMYGWVTEEAEQMAVDAWQTITASWRVAA
jgi:integrase